MFIIMPLVALVYTYVWSVVIKWLSLLIGYLISRLLVFDASLPNEIAYELACGRLGGHAFEFSTAYIFFWPEYEGKSSWEKGFINNKKGCDANFATLSLQTLWPTMEPAYTLEFGDNRTPGYLNVLIDPIELSGEEPEDTTQATFEYFNVPIDQREQFDESLGLFYTLHGENFLRTSRRAVYWPKERLGNNTVIDCSFIRLTELYSCNQTWLKRDISSHIRVDYASAMLPNWQSIQADVERFIDAHKKN